MLFALEENVHQIDLSRVLKKDKETVESAMMRQYPYPSEGWKAIHHDFYLFHESKKTKYPENEELLAEVIGPAYRSADFTKWILRPLEGG